MAKTLPLAKLTKRQQEILDFIRAAITAHGSSPTRAEIAKFMGFRSPNAAEDHVRALARKGVIELISGTSRGIRLKTHETVLLDQDFPAFQLLAGDQLMISKASTLYPGDLVLLKTPQGVLVDQYSERVAHQIHQQHYHLEGRIEGLSRTFDSPPPV